MPDFLGIGAQKAGTTWLYANLSTQPGIWMPREKELHYFDEKAGLKHRSALMRLVGRSYPDERWRRQFGDRIKEWAGERRRPTRWELRYLLGRPSDAWYLKLFRPAKGRVCGEITPNYMALTPAEVEHVHRLLPEARVILMMRNPIERAWSGSVMAAGESLGAGVGGRIAESIESPRSRRLTNYPHALSRWSACYPPERIFVGFMEDVTRHPRLLLEAVCEFLGVTPSGEFEKAERVVHQGPASAMPSWVAARLAEKYAALARSLARRFGGYAEFWSFCAARLRSLPPGDDEIRYPFMQTALWEEWIAGGGEPPAGIQSGRLDRVARQQQQVRSGRLAPGGPGRAAHPGGRRAASGAPVPPPGPPAGEAQPGGDHQSVAGEP